MFQSYFGPLKFRWIEVGQSIQVAQFGNSIEQRQQSSATSTAISNVNCHQQRQLNSIYCLIPSTSIYLLCPSQHRHQALAEDLPQHQAQNTGQF
jgi:hypothetical protein